MKKYAPLILLLFLSIKSFSQTVTLDSITAKKVIIELIEYDACKAELIESNAIISIKEKQLLNYIKITSNKDNQLQILHKVIDNAEKSVLHYKKQNKIYKIVAISGLVLGGILAVK